MRYPLFRIFRSRHFNIFSSIISLLVAIVLCCVPGKLPPVNFLQKSLSLLTLVPVYTLNFILLLAPGYWIGFRSAGPPEEKIARATLGSCFLGYAAFWIYFAHATAGRVFSFLVTATALAALVHMVKRHAFKKHFSSVVGRTYRFLFFAGLIYIGLLNIVPSERSQIHLAQSRMNAGLPADNSLPLKFAEKIYDRLDFHLLDGDWHSSDRPPLQAGITLLFYPILYPAYTEGDYYETLAVILQLLWIPAIIFLLRGLNLSPSFSGPLLIYFLFSGFFFINGVYVWPKLLAAALGIFSLGFMIEWLDRGKKIPLALAGVAFALALLAHGGVIFSLPLLICIFFPGIKKWGRSTTLKTIPVLSLGFGLLAVWSGYQHFYDPPGDRLLKWHLAGKIIVDSVPFMRSLVGAYRNLSVETFFTNKWLNFWELVRTPPIHFLSPLYWRHLDFYSTFWSLGLLNFGWAVLFSKLEWLKRLAIASLLSLVFWCLVMFIPGSVVLHQGSYATPIVLFLVLTLFLRKAAPVFFGYVQGVHYVYFAAVWVFFLPSGEWAGLDPVASAMALFALLKIIQVGLEVAGENAGSPAVASRY
jgi:hypothetical protein